jgi:phage terminase small subunit
MRGINAGMTEEVKPLSKKHQKFVNEYLRCWNGTRAYMAVYPNASYETARANASTLLAETNIAAVVAERLNEAHMSANEALEILSAQARGDIGAFSDRLGQLDLQAAKEAGRSRLIKKFKQRTITKIGKSDDDDDTEIHDVEIELYDAQAAAEKILKIHGKFTDRVDVTSGGEKIKGYIGISPAEWDNDKE